MVIFLTLIVSSIAVLKLDNSIKVSLVCSDEETGCTYTKNSNPQIVHNFKYSEIGQCSLETIYKTNKDDEKVIDYYELSLHVFTLPDLLKIEYSNPDEIAIICGKILNRKAFAIKSKNKIRKK